MKVVQINTFPYKATGAIMMGIHSLLTQQGHDSYVVWGRGREPQNTHEIAITDDWGVKLHGIYTRLTDKTGFASARATKILLKRLDEIKPDIIHLHNIHGYFLNIELLFEYIRKCRIKVVWTLHDCWAFTGHCAYFDMVGCEKWMTGCYHCEQSKTYPASLFTDHSSWNWKKKKELFADLDITVVTPCDWLSTLVKKSYLKDYPVKVIFNGIDLNIFKPSVDKDNIKKKYGLDERPIVLGVASEWTERKGLNDFVKLEQILGDKVQFVIVGLTEKQVCEMQNGIIGLQRTNNINELVDLYSVANLFFNPTYEDNFPTTNLEALACGTPVITYDTGGSPESIRIGQQGIEISIGAIIKKENSKIVNIEKVKELLLEKIETETVFDRQNKSLIVREACREAAMKFDINSRLNEYISLYQELLPGNN